MKNIIIISIICGSLILISGFLILGVWDYNIKLLEKRDIKNEYKIIEKENNKIIQSKMKICDFNTVGNYCFIELNSRFTNNKDTCIFVIENARKDTIDIKIFSDQREYDSNIIKNIIDNREYE